MKTYTKHGIAGGLVGAAYGALGSVYYYIDWTTNTLMPKVIYSFRPPLSYESNILFTDPLNTSNMPLDYITGGLANMGMWGLALAVGGFGIKRIREIKNKALRCTLLGALALGAVGGYALHYSSNYQARTALEQRVQRDNERVKSLEGVGEREVGKLER